MGPPATHRRPWSSRWSPTDTSPASAALSTRRRSSPVSTLAVQMSPSRSDPAYRLPAASDSMPSGWKPSGRSMRVGRSGSARPDGRGGWRQHEAQGQGERGEKSEATGERHGGLQRPWLAASWSGSNDQPALGGEPADRLWECRVRFRRAPHQPARSPLIDTARAPQDRSGNRKRAPSCRPFRIDHGACGLVPGRPPARGSLSIRASRRRGFARLGGTSLAGTSSNRTQKRYGEAPRTRLVPTPKRHYIRISTGQSKSQIVLPS